MSSLRIACTSAVIALATFAAQQAGAHHSPAALYDLDKTIMIEGIVTEYRFINPHIRLYLDVAGADGMKVSWLAEGGTRAVLQRRGWNGSEMKPGDVVRIIGNPSRDGSPLIHCLNIVLADGRRMPSEDFDPALVDARRR